jgi:glycosyltransferase involved in cell wall biosynthesis
VRTRAPEAARDACRLLVITYHFGADGPVGGLRWLGLTKYLARLGWTASIVTAARPVDNDAPIGAQVERCPRLWTFLDGCQLLRRLVFRRSLGSFPIASRVSPRSAPPGLLRQLYREVAAFLAFPDEGRGWILHAAVRVRSVIRRFQPQVVVSSGPPHSAHLVAGLATIGSAARWWIDLRDPWAGHLPTIWQSDWKLGSRMFRTVSPRLERLAFRAAHGVITSTHQLAEALATRYPDVRIVCVPNGVDPERLPPPARHPYAGLGIAYTGTLYGGRDFGPVVRALRIFFERHPEAAQAGSKLRVAGAAGVGHARAFDHAVAAAGIEQYVEVLGPLPRARALDVLSRSRLAVVLAQEQDVQIPAKLYESVAMGIPTLVVAPADSAAGVEGIRVGAAVRDSDDVEGIVGLLVQLWRDGAGRRSPCPVPITYEAIAPLVDRALTVPAPPDSIERGDRPRARAAQPSPRGSASSRARLP